MSKNLSHWAAVGLIVAGASAAHAFPTKTITVIVPFGAGTSVDANGRDFAQALSSVGKASTVVDNRPGAEGTIGAMAVLNAPADGHTLMFTSSSIPVLDPLLKKTMQFDPVKDFIPICTVDLFFIDHVSVAPLLQSGKLRALAVSGDKRVGALPNVPSANEIGVPGYTIKPWFGVYVSSKTPPVVVGQLRELMTQALNTPATRASMEKRGQEPLVVCGNAMTKLQADEINLWRGVLKKAGIQPE